LFYINPKGSTSKWAKLMRKERMPIVREDIEAKNILKLKDEHPTTNGN
jgi:hypothetical protein